MRTKPTTATELMKRLEADPEWVAARDARERELAKRVALLMRELSDLCADLAAAGITVKYISDLASMPSSYHEALPVLLNHLRRPYGERALATIVRAFENKAARNLAWDPLLAALHDGAMHGGGIEAAVAAISAMARPDDLHCVLELIADCSLGEARAILVRNLMRSRKPEARKALLDLRNDPDLEKEIAHRLRSSTAR